MSINTRDLFGNTESVATVTGPQYYDAPFYLELMECHSCPIRAEATKVVPGVGPKSAEILFFGRNPGKDEDQLGSPFIGKGGQELNKMLDTLGISRQKIGIINICKCHTMGDRPPKPMEIEICTDRWLGKELAFFNNAKIIITLGREASQVILGQKVESVAKREGYWVKVSIDGTPPRSFHVCPINHPGYILRAPSMSTRMYNSTLPAMKAHLQTNLREIYDRTRS